jgi:serine protease Do
MRIHTRKYHILSLTLLLASATVALGQVDLHELEEQAISAAVTGAAPSVVKIETIGGLERVGRVLVSTGPTTGLVVGEDGYIVSSAFNFIQQPTSILVTLPGGTRTPAEIVARDHSRMLVLLKVNSPHKLPVPVAVPRGEMTVGQWAIALGRTYDQPEPSISVGIVSAINRIWGKAIQTDANISPANYGGPLVDIRGRVLGVLVPLSPQGNPAQGQSEVAGAEWYDSGIGFAIPLEEILARLSAWREGKDLQPGLLGVSLKPGDIYATPAEIAASQPGSPAYKAGLRKGDTIVEIDGHKVERQAQLRHALGPRYAGDKVALVALRGSGEEQERVEVTVELAEQLVPYEHPFLGLLPLRDSPEGEVLVRYVYPGSPAAAVGVQAGDAIAALDDTPITGATQLRELVANLEPKVNTKLQVRRGGESLTVELTPASLPTDIPDELPPAIADPPAAPQERPATGLIEIKLPEEANECLAYVPENYHPQVPHGLVILLSAPGPVDREQLVERWKTVCEERQLIVLAPMSAAGDKWDPTETDVVRKLLDDLMANYSVDSMRIVSYGYQTGGAMAYLVAFGHGDRVRAICAVDAVPPARTAIPDNDPINRLAFYLAKAERSPAATGMAALATRLKGAKFPVIEIPLGEQPRQLNDDELAELGRWIDTLDRI